MKLAEALLLRGDLQKKLSSLRERIGRNVLLQEGSPPHENPQALLHEAAAAIDALQDLVVKINMANLGHSLPDGRSLTVAMAARDGLMQHHALLQSVIEATRQEPERYSAREIKWVVAVEVAQLQKQSDDLSRQIREINALIQETNWKIEV